MLPCLLHVASGGLEVQLDTTWDGGDEEQALEQANWKGRRTIRVTRNGKLTSKDFQKSATLAEAVVDGLQNMTGTVD